MCPIFVYKTAEGIFGITSNTSDSALPETERPWEYVKTVTSADETSQYEDKGCLDVASDYERMQDIYNNLDNDLFFEVMSFLEREGYLVIRAWDEDE